jgi:hypothetical protein
MIRTLIARALARLSSWAERTSIRLYRVQSRVNARRAIDRLAARKL